ncbi:caveolin-1-like [Saccoglossus kowalevskii]|uniref:Caveolin n=1 Tax=Saccoglossus kowalevskii TaxID=10224 RepID=A0ABM0MLQ8_SACKO|nr:PREDICTED: caveolin-3-like isoform X2 [Saccoglossus kowalevskii]
MDPESLDMVNRDPQELNPHVRALWEDVFAEPEGTHSIDGVWRCSFKTFNFAKSCCYKILTVLCAVPSSLMWGFCFAFQSFEQIWCVTPMLKALMIDMGAVKRYYTIVCGAICVPVCETCGACLSQIRITLTKN